jgi:phosphohistidine phosphatase
MRILTLFRHAKSAWDYPELSDFERPLNARGKRDVPAMAAKLKDFEPRPDRLVSSPALRAVTTARLFAEHTGLDAEAIACDARIYEASPNTLMQVLRAVADDAGHVMLFGHNPAISQCAQLLADCPFDEMPTCAAVRIELDVRAWSDVTPGCGKVLRYDYPKQNG